MAVSVQCGRESIRTTTGLLQWKKNNSDSIDFVCKRRRLPLHSTRKTIVGTTPRQKNICARKFARKIRHRTKVSIKCRFLRHSIFHFCEHQAPEWYSSRASSVTRRHRCDRLRTAKKIMHRMPLPTRRQPCRGAKRANRCQPIRLSITFADHAERFSRRLRARLAPSFTSPKQ